MHRCIVTILAGLLLVGCDVGISTQVSVPTPIVAVTLPQPPVTLVATSSTPMAAYPSILDRFPLGLGATWVYSVTVDYAEKSAVTHWSGLVTETVKSATRQGDAWFFSAEIQGHPLRSSGKGNNVHQYIARENHLYAYYGDTDIATFVQQHPDLRANEMLQWPLKVGQSWGAPEFLARGDGAYVWRVDTQGNVETLTGAFKDCFQLTFVTNPDDTRDWFCPGVGIARHEYHHHGSVLDEVDVLQKRIAGAPAP